MYKYIYIHNFTEGRVGLELDLKNGLTYTKARGGVSLSLGMVWTLAQKLTSMWCLP